MKNLLFIFRKLRKNSTSTSLGIAGLVAGIVCVVYIFLLVTDEISFDRFHSRLDRIFVVHAYLEGGSSKVDFNGCPPAVATALKDEFPEVETTCRYIPAYFNYLVAYGDNKFMQQTAYADFSFFDIFSFPFKYGDKGEANDPNRIVLTEKAALKYFGESDPVGKIVKVDNRLDMRVSGIIKDIPSNSSINFDALLPLENIGVYYSRTDFLTSWYNNSFVTYGLLRNPGDYEKVASAIGRRIQKDLPESTNFLRAYKFRDGYLYQQKHIRNVQIYCLIALLVLLAATLNFINLNTARSSKHAKETGLRKTFGASRLNVVRLIYTDVAIICLLAYIFAIANCVYGVTRVKQSYRKGDKFFYTLFIHSSCFAYCYIYGHGHSGRQLSCFFPFIFFTWTNSEFRISVSQESWIDTKCTHCRNVYSLRHTSELNPYHFKTDRIPSEYGSWLRKRSTYVSPSEREVA